MYIDNNTLILNYRTEAVRQILEGCGLEGSSVLFKGKDYLSVLKNIKNDEFEVGLPTIKETIKTNDECQFIIVIDGKKYILKVRVTTMKLEGGKLVCDLHIIQKVPIELKSRLEEMMDALEVINKRKFDRVYCNEETLKRFPINPKFKIMFPERQYTCFIKNISINGISFVTTADFMNEDNESYILSVEFRDPAENLCIAGKLVRRHEIRVSGQTFCECAMKTEENIYLSGRIMGYLRTAEILQSNIRVRRE